MSIDSLRFQDISEDSWDESAVITETIGGVELTLWMLPGASPRVTTRRSPVYTAAPLRGGRRSPWPRSTTAFDRRQSNGSLSIWGCGPSGGAMRAVVTSPFAGGSRSCWSSKGGGRLSPNPARFPSAGWPHPPNRPRRDADSVVGGDARPADVSHARHLGGDVAYYTSWTGPESTGDSIPGRREDVGALVGGGDAVMLYVPFPPAVSHPEGGPSRL